MAARIFASTTEADARKMSEGPATLPMRREVVPMLGGVLEIPEGVRFVRLGIYDARDTDGIGSQPGRMVTNGTALALVVDCLKGDGMPNTVTSSFAS